MKQQNQQGLFYCGLTFSFGAVGMEYSEETSLLSDSPFSPIIDDLFLLFLPFKFGAEIEINSISTNKFYKYIQILKEFMAHLILSFAIS